MLHPTMLDDVGPTMLASFEQAVKMGIEQQCHEFGDQAYYCDMQLNLIQLSDH